MSNDGLVVVREALDVAVEWPGEEPSGWLPPGAAKPLPTAPDVFRADVRIFSSGSGFNLEWTRKDSGRVGDFWYETLDAAIDGALQYFGVKFSR